MGVHNHAGREDALSPTGRWYLPGANCRSRRSQAAPPSTSYRQGEPDKSSWDREQGGSQPLSVPWIAEFQAAITKAAEIRRNPVLHDWIGRYACYHPGENPFAPEQRIITQNPALILPGTHTKPVTYESIIDKWMDKTKNGKKKGKKAREDMEREVNRFTAWLKLKILLHDDMTQVRFENCRDYRYHLYTSDANPDHFKTHSNQL